MKTLFIVLGVLTFLFIIVGGLIFLGARGLGSRPTTAEEQKLLLDLTSSFHPDYVAQFSLARCESSIAKTNIDGSLELEYEYDSEKHPGSPFLFYSSEAEINRTAKDAEESFDLSIFAYKTGAATVKGRKIIPLTGFFTLGEQNYAARIEDSGSHVGTIVITRQGAILHSLLTLGMTFDTKDELEDLFQPVLDESKTR